MARRPVHYGPVLRLEQLERRDAPALSGTLDPSFGVGGKVITPVGTAEDRATSMVIDASGRIVVVGRAAIGGSDDVAVVRYNEDGSLDPTFGTGGKVTVPVGTGHDRGNAVTIDSNGRIVIAGTTYNGTDDDFAVVRLNSTGTLDATFGNAGKVTTTIGTSNDVAKSVAIDALGRIVVAGYRGAGSNDFALVRYNSDGTLDGSFGTGGKVTTEFGINHDEAFSVAIDSSNRIIAAGRAHVSTSIDLGVARFNIDGTLDTSFGTGGKFSTAGDEITDFAASVRIDQAGRIVIAGNRGRIVRLMVNGGLDDSFGYGGIAAVGVANVGNSLAIDRIGRLLVVGTIVRNGTEVFGLIRCKPNGTIDESFGVGGIAVCALGTIQDIAFSVAIDRNDRIVTAGYSQQVGSSYDFAAARFRSNDSPSFTDDGVLPAILQAMADPPGRKVSSLFVGLFNDPNVGDTLAGVAVVGNATNPDTGAWQYSTDDGATWFNVGTVADGASALALSASTRVRFLPQPWFAGEPEPLTVRAIDSTFTGAFTAGATRQTVNSLINGGDKAISGNTARVVTSVFPNPLGGAWLLANGDLYVSGTAGNDVIGVNIAADPSKLDVVLNGESFGPFDLSAITGKIVVRGFAGNDKITLASKIAKGATLFGDGGNDMLTAAAGDDLLDGGAGNDTQAGGLGNDTYRFADGWGVDTVTEAMSAGNDRFDFSAVTGNLSITRGSTLIAQSGANKATGANIENAIGGTGNDTLASAAANTWNLVAANAGLLNGAFNFSGIENLTGGGSTDNLLIGAGGSLSGMFDAKTGVNILNFAAVALPVTINLATGTATSIGKHSGITSMVGGTAGDTLIGRNAATTWNIASKNAGKAGAFSFTGVENLTGGLGADWFSFAKGAAVAGVIDGGGATDTLSYAAFTAGVRVNLLLGTATSTGGIAGIENVTAGAGNDILIGNALASLFIGGSGRDILIGGQGIDNLQGGFGDDILIGGTTDHDDDTAALELLMLEWQSAALYGTRVDHLLGTLAGGANGTTLLNGTTIQNDGALDLFKGNAGLDWFMIHLGELTPDRAAAERVSVL